MLYLDLTPGELDALNDFHNRFPDRALRVYADELVDAKNKTYRKRVTDLYGNETDIADPTFE